MSGNSAITRTRALLLSIGAFAAAIAGSLVAVAIVGRLQQGVIGQPATPWDGQPWGWQWIEGVWAFWVFLFGACIGSFLNVVIYRMPVGITIVSKPSYCPRCQAKISVRDNIPIWGWLALRGRCRGCQKPISARYPAVELIVALLFQWLYVWEVIAVGLRENAEQANSGDVGVMGLFAAGDWTPLARFAFHAFVLAVLIVYTMIAWDDHRPPRSLVLFTTIVACAIGCFWPAVYLLAPWWLGGETPVENAPSIRLQPLLGAVAAMFAGTLVRRWYLRHGRHELPYADAAFWATILVGIAFGWQIVLLSVLVSVIASCVLSYVICRWIGGRAVPYPASLLLALAAVLVWLES
jgi:prepilin signal peptidase PulO-like enzyme (type II secretory pathway)